MELLRGPNRKTREGFRNYVMLLAFLDTGLRLSEALSLALDRVDLARGSLPVVGKGEKEREVYMGKTLRHTFATSFIRNGGDVFTLQRILGHSSIKTCTIYVHMSGKHVREAMPRFLSVDRMER